MDIQTFLNEEADIYADMFQGGFVIRGFVRTVIESYDGKSDWRDFTANERNEILLNCHRMIGLLLEAERA
ncbi:MAG: hypothetical protein K5905_30205 [Roseibium sp.]|uniref:hypothetical protein n=1 Tax=Roseibium sp. TaxID=1936156 RepID=UPI002601B721|nr:hypothetical protein [Roseibium sp.]MCV0429732.1 hypothetical protein [Roseibium sp.]